MPTELKKSCLQRFTSISMIGCQYLIGHTQTSKIQTQYSLTVTQAKLVIHEQQTKQQQNTSNLRKIDDNIYNANDIKHNV